MYEGVVRYIKRENNKSQEHYDLILHTRKGMWRPGQGGQD